MMIAIPVLIFAISAISSFMYMYKTITSNRDSLKLIGSELSLMREELGIMRRTNSEMYTFLIEIRDLILANDNDITTSLYNLSWSLENHVFKELDVAVNKPGIAGLAGLK